jgi:hypothetical protein
MRSGGGWKHLMAELTPKPDKIGGKSKKKL